jgi:hypothetical protein
VGLKKPPDTLGYEPRDPLGRKIGLKLQPNQQFPLVKHRGIPLGSPGCTPSRTKGEGIGAALFPFGARQHNATVSDEPYAIDISPPFVIRLCGTR